MTIYSRAEFLHTPSVTVIMPTFNNGNYIEEALESLFAQSFQNFEIIVVDDGSSDDTRERLEQYRDRITYIYQENQGVSRARNRALEIARGSLIAFLDADDIFLPGKLQDQVAVFRANPQADIVNSGFIFIDEEGKKISDMPWWIYFPTQDLETVLVHKPVLPGALMIRKEALLKVGGFDPDLHIGEDQELVFRLMLAGSQLAWLEQLTLGYRQHRKSATQKDLANFSRAAYKVLMDFFAREDIPQEWRRYKKKSIFHSLVWIAWKLFLKDERDLMYEYLEESLQYRILPFAEVEEEWLNRFVDLSCGFGVQLDKESLRIDNQWRGFIDRVLG